MQTMTTPMHQRDRSTASAGRSRSPAAGTRRFATILAVRHGQVFVRSAACPESGWLVRAPEVGEYAS